MGVHDAPLAREEVQSLRLPLAMAPDASHGFAAHVALVSTRSKHDDAPETVYPVSHVGVQLDPLARVSVQVPAPPLAGGTAASHALSLRTHTAIGPWSAAAELAYDVNSLHAE